MDVHLHMYEINQHTCSSGLELRYFCLGILENQSSVDLVYLCWLGLLGLRCICLGASGYWNAKDMVYLHSLGSAEGQLTSLKWPQIVYCVFTCVC